MKATTLLLFCSVVSLAQNPHKFHITEFVSGQIAYLNYRAEVNPSRKFPTRELKLGACLIKPISKHFELLSRIGVGIKFKRLPDNRLLQLAAGKEAYILRDIYFALNESLTKKDTYFIDLPVILHYKINFNWGIELGFNYREYGFTDTPFIGVDYGPLLNLAYSLNRFSIFCGYTMGLNSMYSQQGNYYDENDNSISYTWDAKSNSVQIGLEYNLFKKRQRPKKLPLRRFEPDE